MRVLLAVLGGAVFLASFGRAAPITIDHGSELLLVFEASADAYQEHNGVAGYWGPISSSIDWCERNYVVSHYVAEWFNCLSNLGMILIGVFGVFASRKEGLELRFVLFHAAIMVIGLGSAAFHGTLTHIGQQGDETPMVFGSALWVWGLAFRDPAFEARHPALGARCAWAALALCFVFAAVHYYYRFTAVFQILILTITFVAVYMVSREWKKCTDAAAMRVGYRYYNLAGWTALALWICDQHFCVHLHALPGGMPNPQFHAWWHFLMAVNMQCGSVFLAFQRATLSGHQPEMRFACGGMLPYVSVDRKRS
mmetsp:Transcript_28187/g.60609  ORF Transcript_28187/g.60609 Transcript_28187/m.60609 type:complete len:310 (-) Transcript_28187:227-1156(-)